jgi:hypothetical protein
VVDRSDDASCLLGLEGLAVERVVLTAVGVKIVQLVTDDLDAARCPGCEVVSASGKGWVLTRPRDLPCGGEFAQMQWRKRRWRCRTEDCARQTFTEQVAQVPAGMRTTTRLRAALAVAVEMVGISPRWLARTGCRGRRWRGRCWPGARWSWSSPGPQRCWGWTRPGSGGRDGCPMGITLTVGSGGSARIRGKPGSSTSPVTRRYGAKSTGGPAPRCRPGSPSAPRSSVTPSRW